ncbi:MAG: hypothetical protein IKG46_12795 [Solobacterium sp.]|nr:hypothetical protein [Solobacterium sp.]
MSEIINMYRRIAAQLSEIGNSYIKSAEDTIRLMELSGEDQDRAEFFTSQLKELKDCLDQIRYYRQIAEKHITSTNTLPIVPREVDLTKLKTWCSRINIYSDDDPYAARLYVLCCSNELYLEKKISQVNDILTALGCGTEDSEEKLLENHEKDITEQCRALFESPEFERFMTMLYPENAVLKPEESNTVQTELPETQEDGTEEGKAEPAEPAEPEEMQSEDA